MKRLLKLCVPLLCCIVFFGTFFTLSPEVSLPGKAPANADILLLDPGHGGIDGGAVSTAGTCEKEINLAIAENIRKLAEDDGWTVVMTREDDRLLSVNTEGSIRSQKTEDLHARKDMIQNTAPLLAVSIHLNSFKEDPSVYGAQTFYPGKGETPDIPEESKRLAEAIQKEAARQGIIQDILLEINIGAEASKSGFAPDEIWNALPLIAGFSNLRVLPA